MINTKRSQSGSSREAKIAKIITPAAPIIKLVKAKPPKVSAPVKPVTPVQVTAKKRNTVTSEQLNAPIKVASPPKDDTVKPVLSSKHIVKHSKAKQIRPAAAFSITFARPAAGLEVIQNKPVPRPQTRKRQIASTEPAIEPKIATQPIPDTSPVQPVVPPQPAPQPAPVATLKPPVIAPQPQTRTEWLVKPVTPAPVYPPHEIIKSNVSLKDDIISNPNDYEKQPFPFDLRCPNGHYWPEGEPVPTSKGIGFCLKCGERLSKPRSKKRHRRQKFP